MSKLSKYLRLPRLTPNLTVETVTLIRSCCRYFCFEPFVQNPRTRSTHPCSTSIMTATEEEVLALFKKFFDFVDKDSSGTIEKKELEKLDADMASEMLKDCDADGDGNISWKEWAEFLKKKHAEKPMQKADIPMIDEFFRRMKASA